MTFVETEHPRIATGEFTAKKNDAPAGALPDPPPVTDFDTAYARLQEANAAYHEHRDNLTTLAMKYLDEGMPDQAQKVRFEWSDQGDYLTVGTVWDAEENQITDDLEDDGNLDVLNDVVANLGGTPTSAPQLKGDRHGNVFWWERESPSTPGVADEVEAKMYAEAEAAAKASLASSVAAEDAFIAGIPAHVVEVRLTASDQGDFPCIASAKDANGNAVDIDPLADEDGQRWEDLDFIASDMRAISDRFEPVGHRRQGNWVWRRPA